jgi:hypothetical protein
MKIHDLKDTEGRVFAFEVPNTLLTRREACKHVRSIPGARLLSGQKELRDEEFCLFELQGQRFKAWSRSGTIAVIGLGLSHRTGASKYQL